MKEKTAKRLRNYDKPLLNDLMRADSRANLDLANPKGALYNPTVELLISYPDEIEDILKRVKQWRGNDAGVLDEILKRFEDKAKTGLKRSGKSLVKDYNESELDVIASKLFEVLRAAKEIRLNLKEKNATGAALSMLRFCFAALGAALHDEIIQGAIMIDGNWRGGGDKGPNLIAAALKSAANELRNDKPYSTLRELRNYFFSKSEEYKAENFSVYGDGDGISKDDKVIIRDCITKKEIKRSWKALEAYLKFYPKKKRT